MNKPNIILINCDDLGYGDLGCYGSKLNDTPNIDKLSEEGIKFTNFYMASPVCSPSRAAMLTGCYPPRISFGSFDDNRNVLFPGSPTGLNPNEITIANQVKSAGYNTKIIGKWHCGDQKEFLPTNYGFDSYYGIPYSNDMGRAVIPEDMIPGGSFGPIDEETRSRREKFPPLPLISDNEVIQEQPDQAGITERYVEESIKFIRKNKKQPFFLYLAHMYVHLPLYAPERFINNSRNGRYGAAVSGIDWSTAMILDELKRLDLDENTLIIFTSDNGSNTRNNGSNAPLRGKKQETYEGGQRVPMIMKWPKKIPANSTSDELVSSIDFFRTISSILGIKIDSKNKIDSLDFSNVMYSPINSKSPRETFFYYKQNNLEAVRNKKWKLHQQKDGKKVSELYNLENDISEKNNVYEKHPEIVLELQKLLDECAKELGDEFSGIQGSDIRLPGKVENPSTLTSFNPNSPYFAPMYDIPDWG